MAFFWVLITLTAWVAISSWLSEEKEDHFVDEHSGDDIR